jgi:translocation and assembly module TamB
LRFGVRMLTVALVVGTFALASGPTVPQDQEQQQQQQQDSGWVAGWIRDRIQSLLSGPGRTVTIGRIDIGFRLDVTLFDVAIADDRGNWLTIDRASLDWAPGALFRREFRIRALKAGRIALERLPEGQPEPEPPSEPFSLPQIPELPVGLDLQELTVDELHLAQPVLGTEAATLRINGSAQLGRGDGGLAANLDIDRLDKAGTAKLIVDYAAQASTLDLNLNVDEPPGSVLARALNIPGLPPVTARLAGSGPLAEWRGNLNANAGDIAQANGQATVRGVESGYALSLTADADIQRLLPDPAAQLVGNAVHVQAESLIAPNQRIELNPARLTLAAGEATITGQYALDRDELAFDYRLEGGPESSLRQLVPDSRWQTVRLTGRAEGPVGQPTITAELTADQIAAAGVTANRVELQTRAVPSAPLSEAGAVVDVTLNGAVTDLSGIDPQLAELAGPRITLDGRAVVEPGSGQVQIAQLRTDTAVAVLNATGLLEQWGQKLGAQIRLDVPDLARLPAPGLVGSAEVNADVRVEDGGKRMRAETTAVARDLNSTDPGLQPIFRDVTGQTVTLNLTGNSEDRGETIRLDRIALDALAGQLIGEATVRQFGQGITGNAKLTVPELAKLSAVAGTPMTGSTVLTADLSEGDADTLVRADLKGTASEFATGTPAADALLGRLVELTGLVNVGNNGAIAVRDLKIDGQNVGATAQAALQDNRLDAQWRVDLPKLAVLSAPLQTDMAGAVTAQGTVRGALDALEAQADIDSKQLRVAGRTLSDTGVTVQAAGLPQAPTGTLNAGTKVEGQPLRASTRFALENQMLALSDLSFGTEQDRITGAIRVALDSLTARGQLNGNIGNLRPIGALAGQPLSGALRLDLNLDAPNGQQQAILTARASQFQVAGQGAPLFAADSLNVRADVRNALTKPRIDASLDGSSMAAGGVALDRFNATANGDLGALRFDVRTNGTAGAPAQPLRLALAGSAALDGPMQKIRLQQLDGAYGTEPFQLAGPATVSLGPNRTAVENLVLTSGQARLAVQGALTDKALEGSATLDAIPLTLARLADPTLDFDGRLDGQVSLGGTLRAPRGDLDLRVNNFQVAQARAAGVTGFDAGLQGRWRDGRLVLDGTVGGQRGGVDLALRADMPLVLRPQPLTIDVPAAQPLRGSLRGNADLARFNDLLAATGDRAQGRLNLDLTLGGTVATPQLGGLATVADGQYVNVEYGTTITDINARLRGDGTRLTIEAFDGRTPEGGIVRVEGAVNVDPTDPRALNLRVSADDARLVQIDLVTARVDGGLSLTGPLNGPQLKGNIRIDRADVRLPDRLPPSVVQMDVVEINSNRGERVPLYPKQEKPDRPVNGSANAGLTIGLDIKVTAQNQIFVRGRGLNAEFASDLAVSGTSAAPRINGQLTLVSGYLEFLTKRFEFDRANINFVGDTDPTLDVLAEATAGDTTAQVNITGRASRPDIALTSSPELPQDEVLARVIFEKPLSQLTAIEAVQLAQSVVELAGFGGGPGLLDRVRNTLGVDRLEILSAQEGEGIQGAGVAAGRYVSRDVYVGTEQRVGGDTRFVVEYDLTDNLKVLSDVGIQSGTGIGLRYEWEY